MLLKILKKTGLLAAFISVTAVVAWFWPLEDMPTVLNLKSHPDEMARVFGGDPQYYLEMARHWINHRNFASLWHPMAFPPGTSIIWGVLIELFGESNLMISSLIFSICLWGLALYLVFESLKFPRNPWLRFLLVNSFWLMATNRDWSLGVGTCFSESKSMPFMMMSFAFLNFWIQKQRTRDIYLAVGCMALATYVRVYFDTQGLMIFGGLAAIALAPFAGLIGRSLVQLVSRKSQKRIADRAMELWSTVKEVGSKRRVQHTVGALLILVLSTGYWKVRNAKSEGVRDFGMGPAHVRMTFNNLWLPTQRLPEYIIGGNSACIANPDLCRIIEKAGGPEKTPFKVLRDSALTTLMTNSAQWYKHRASVFSTFWISRPWKIENLKDFRLHFEGLLLLVLGLTTLFLSLKSFWERSFALKAASAIVIIFWAQNFLMFTFAGMDYRHSFPIRIFFFFTLFWFLGEKLRTVRSQEQES